MSAVDENESAAAAGDTEAIKVDEDDDVPSGAGTELLLKTPEKSSEEIGTEFLLGGADQEVSADKDKAASVAVGTTRRRRSHVDADADPIDVNGPGRGMNDITADALSIQPTGYTLETAHVRLHSF